VLAHLLVEFTRRAPLMAMMGLFDGARAVMCLGVDPLPPRAVAFAQMSVPTEPASPPLQQVQVQLQVQVQAPPLQATDVFRSVAGLSDLKNAFLIRPPNQPPSAPPSVIVSTSVRDIQNDSTRAAARIAAALRRE
jgi:hypothetical protein